VQRESLLTCKNMHQFEDFELRDPVKEFATK